MSVQETTMFVAMELSKKNWRPAFGDGSHQPLRNIGTGDESRLLREVALSKEELGPGAESRVVFCYEAGRAGPRLARTLALHWDGPDDSRLGTASPSR